MEDVITVTNFFIRGIKPYTMNSRIQSLLAGMTLFDSHSKTNDLDSEGLTVESIPSVCKVMLQDGKMNWGRILAIIWLGVHIKKRYPDETNNIYNAIVQQLLNQKQWIMRQNSYIVQLCDYVASFFGSVSNDNKYFVLT